MRFSTKDIRILALAFFLGLIMQAAAYAASVHTQTRHLQTHDQHQKRTTLRDMGGTEVKTAYFNVVLPQGWGMPKPVQERPDGVDAVFASQSAGMAITFHVLAAPLSAKDLATQTLANMRKSGLKTGQLTEKDGMFRATVRGKAKGVAWFGSNGKLCAATVIFGANESAANELLGAVKAEEKGLFPTSVN